MPRPKKAPAKVAVKRTRRNKEIDAPKPAPIPEAWIDEQLRKECLGIAAANGSSISTLVADAQGIYGFVKGGVSFSGVMQFTPPETQASTRITGEMARNAGLAVVAPPDLYVYSGFPKSKLDAHTL